MPKNYTLNTNIKNLIIRLKIKPIDFAKRIGYNRPDNIYNVIHNKVTVSPIMLNRIFTAMPEYRDFILSGSDKINIAESQGVLKEEPKKYSHKEQFVNPSDLIEYLREKDRHIINQEEEIRDLIRKSTRLEVELEIVKKEKK